MPTPPPATPDQDPTPATPRLFGSKAADIVAGIIAAGLWWTIGYAVVAATGPMAGVAVLIVCAVFVVQLILLGARVRGATVFVVTQILTAILLPLLALGLLFGACLLSSGGFH